MSSQTLTRLKAGFETTGSTRWIMQTIQNLQLDRRNGFELDLILHQQHGDARRTSPEAALLAGEIDLIDTDWLSICRARSAGTSVSAVFPYGRIMGGLIAHESAGIASLSQLQQRRIGLLRETDKNWQVLRAWVKQNHDFDPAEYCETIIVPSKIELESQLKNGLVDAAIIFWHRIPEILKSPGLHEVCDLVDLVESLTGASPATTFFVFRDDFINHHPEVIAGFCRAYGAAVEALTSQPELWSAVSGVPAADAAAADSSTLYSRWQRRMVTTWSATDWGDLMRLHDLIAQMDSRSVVTPNPEWFPPVSADNSPSFLKDVLPCQS